MHILIELFHFLVFSHFFVIAKIYAYLNERLYIDLYPGNRDEGTDLSTTSASSTALELYEDESRHISLNELLVQKKFAEFKLETDICQQKSIRRDLNYYHEISAKDINPIDEFPLNFDGDILEKNEFQFDVNFIYLNILYLLIFDYLFYYLHYLHFRLTN